MAGWIPPSHHDGVSYLNNVNTVGQTYVAPPGVPQPGYGTTSAQQNQNTSNIEQDLLIAGGGAIATSLIGTGIYGLLNKPAPPQLTMATIHKEPEFSLQWVNRIGGFPVYQQSQGLCGFATMMTLLEGHQIEGKDLHHYLMDAFHAILADRRFMKTANDTEIPTENVEWMHRREFAIAYNHLLLRIQHSHPDCRLPFIQPPEGKSTSLKDIISGHCHRTENGEFVYPLASDAEAQSREAFFRTSSEKEPDDKNKLSPCIDRFAVFYSEQKKNQADNKDFVTRHWVALVKHTDSNQWHVHDSSTGTATKLSDDTGEALDENAHPHEALQSFLKSLSAGSEALRTGKHAINFEILAPKVAYI